MKIKFTWPTKILYQRNGASNMDETWDEEIFPVMMGPILEKQLEYKGELLWDDITFSYELEILKQAVDWQDILKRLEAEEMTLEIKIWVKSDYGDYSLVYADLEERRKKEKKRERKKARKKRK